MHAFWLTLIVPAVLLAQWIWPVMKIRSIWSTTTLILATLTIGYLAMGLVSLGSEQQTISGVLMMAVFRCLSATDLPMIQVLLGTAIGWLCSDRAYYRNLDTTPATAS